MSHSTAVCIVVFCSLCHSRQEFVS